VTQTTQTTQTTRPRSHRLAALTERQLAAVPTHAQRWIEIGQCTDEADWDRFTDAARRCYEFAGVPWPGRVERFPSPFAAAPIAVRRIIDQRDPERGSVYDTVREAAMWAAHRAVMNAVTEPLHNLVSRAFDNAMDMVDHAVGLAVDGAVHNALYAAVGDSIKHLPYWYYYLHGLGEITPVSAVTSFFRKIGLQLDRDDGDLWELDRAYCDTQASAGWWWPLRDGVVVADRPLLLRVEQTDDGAGYRPHCENGPAITWADGWSLYFWHGTQVPAGLIERGWTAERILREPNAEIRRCAVERIGWDRFISDANLRPVSPTVPDPGNPGQTLTLYDAPERIFPRPVRVLLCTNGTTERDGTRRRYGLLVPPHFRNPVAAAAWTYGWTTDTYRTLARRA
jgi:Domain of unknown function (DUF6745)